MTERSKNLPASIQARLLNRAQAHGEDFNLLLKRYAAERFLYRLGASPQRGRFVLKGAMLFTLWDGLLYRPTRDLDFASYGDPGLESLTAAMREICALPCTDDGVIFLADNATVEPIRDHADNGGLRVRMQVKLGNTRISLQIDVGYGDVISAAAQESEYPVLLDFLPRPRIRAYSRESVVAEKLHALVELEMANSRMKDFYDLYVLSTQFAFDGKSLSQAIAATFSRRRRAIPVEPPVGLTPAFFADTDKTSMWRRYRDRDLPEAPADFSVVGVRLRDFLIEPLGALAGNAAFAATWQPRGPWR
jgi:hypothetical protein